MFTVVGVQIVFVHNRPVPLAKNYRLLFSGMRLVKLAGLLWLVKTGLRLVKIPQGKLDVSLSICSISAVNSLWHCI